MFFFSWHCSYFHDKNKENQHGVGLQCESQFWGEKIPPHTHTHTHKLYRYNPIPNEQPGK